jgi:hypothetical protein
VTANRALLPEGTYTASLESGQTVQLRTPSPCGTTPSVDLSATSAVALSCQERVEGPSQVSRFRWFVRSEKYGESYLTLKWPRQIGDIIRKESQWAGRVKRDGRVVTRYVAGPEGRPWVPGRDRSDLREVPEIISMARPTYGDSGWEVDLAAQQFTLPIRFETTLGVSAQLYGNLSVLGAALSGLLGGGWLWQLLAWFKARPKTRKKNERR